MRLNVNVIFASFLILVSNNVSAENLPNAITQQLPPNSQVLTVASGLLNQDARTDYLVVLQDKHEKKLTQQGNAPARPLLIFVQKTKGAFELVAKNDAVVFKADEGGQCDPFLDGDEGLVIKNHFFTVQNSVACGHHWTDYITFTYKPSLNKWVFYKRVMENWVLNASQDPQAEALVLDARKVEVAKPKHVVLFERYAPN
jgi:hypothetical protein